MSFGNQFRTVLLLGLLTALLLWVGSFFGQGGLTIAIALSLAMNFISYFWSDKIVLALYRAKEAKDGRLHTITAEVAKKAGIPIPKTYVIPSLHSNAFATGRNPSHAAVAATQGILDLLTDDELKGVIAHEVSHIKNRDILISTIAATIAGVISYVAMMARYAAMFGGRDRDSRSGLELLVLGILTPIIATLIQLAISRSREFMADASGAKILRNGEGLAKALEKLDGDIRRKPLQAMSATETTAHLFIANPFGGMKGLVHLFMTHPPMDERIKRLKSMRF